MCAHHRLGVDFCCQTGSMSEKQQSRVCDKGFLNEFGKSKSIGEGCKINMRMLVRMPVLVLLI